MSYWYYNTGPRNVKGGIKAHTTRNKFGQNWWSKKWLSVLDEEKAGQRLARGRSYARRGQVTFIDVKKGIITSEIQGSQYSPYSIIIKVATIPKQAWVTIANELFARPNIAASLLAGKLPEEVDDIITKLGYSLVPSDEKSIRADCECYDWIRPCKHIAAVCYILAEELDRNPLLLFRMLGAEMDDLLKMAKIRSSNVGNNRITKTTTTTTVKADPLTTDHDKFWGRQYVGNEPDLSADIPEIPAALIKQLGSFPFWRGKEKFLPTMDDIYGSASKVGQRNLVGKENASWMVPDNDYLPKKRGGR